ncbi:MAG TPA: hypothetical protein VGO11_26865 [Chthoniobacteraceae bacterium]|jgi:hypothetical protein|nr:hypothetical protein [Chthoniobacteraceae bacterium]
MDPFEFLSSLPPCPISTAIVAMRREWAEVRAHQPLYHPELPEEDRYEVAVRQMAVFRAFLERHRAVFALPDLPERDRHAQETTRRLQLFIDWCEQEQRRLEEALQENADRTDFCDEFVLECLKQLVRLESMPQEKWDALPIEQALKLNDLLEALRANREAMLGTLPIELRREWERRLG